MANTASSKRGSLLAQVKVSGTKNLAKVLGMELVGISLLGLIVFYYLALISFSPFDESLVSANIPPAELANMAGIFGANLASGAIYLVGAVAFFLPFPILHLVLCLLRRKAMRDTVRIVGGWSILIVSAPLAASAYLVPLTLHQMRYSSGGIIGDWLAVLVAAYFGKAGLGVVIATIACCALILISGVAFFSRLCCSTRWSLTALVKGAFKRINFVFFSKSKKKERHKDEVSRELISFAGDPEILCNLGGNTESDLGTTIAGIEQLELRSDVCHEDMIVSDESYVGRKPCSADYSPPSADIFRTSEHMGEIDSAQRKQNESVAEQLKKAFGDFGIKGDIVAIQPGPAVTVFEFQHNAGTKLSKMTSLTDDIALALKVDSIFIHPVSGKNAIGVQVPNYKREMVYFGDIIRTPLFQTAASPLTFVIGKTLKGEAYCADLAAMPHLLMAGQTGSGKSVAINAILASIVMKSSPDEVRMILVDPKILELKVYEGIPHLLMPVITEPKRAAAALRWATQEMDRRYRLMEVAKVRHIQGFNQFWEGSGQEKKEELLSVGGCGFVGRLPYIIVVIDELADLMLTAPKDVEASIQRLAQKARACGIHLVLATQRPSVDVITGVIKANLPCRIAFKVFSRVDSRTILDSIGAEKLLGKGDMLYLRPGSSKLERLQGAFLEDSEVVHLVETLKENSEFRYDEDAIGWIDRQMQAAAETVGDVDMIGADQELDAMWQEACSIAEKYGVISASFLQRHLKIGYNRAARVVETMERRGLVGQADGSKPRKWLGTTVPR